MQVAAVLIAVGVGSVSALQEDRCDGRGSLAVVVRDDSGLVPIPAATVVLRWADAVRPSVRQAADLEGRLALCVPRDASGAVVWAEFGDASSEEATVALPSGASTEVELRLLFGDASTGRVVGQVLEASSRRPVAAAQVVLSGRDEAVQTDRRGHFVLAGLSVGEHELSVSHLGYAPFVHPVTVARGVTTEAVVGLSPNPVELEPLVVVAARPRRLEVAGFYERRHWSELAGNGTFFDAAAIARRNPTRISHMVADVPGVRLGNCGLQANGCQLYGTRVSGGFTDQGCKMNIFVDGNLVIRGGDERRAREMPGFVVRPSRVGNETINDLVITAEVAGIEVYTGAASLPAEFSGSDARCGAVVIWTK